MICEDAQALLGLFGAPFKVKPGVWRGVSPIVYFKAGDPPFLIRPRRHRQDRTARALRKKLLAALQKAGVPVELITVKRGNHNLGRGGE